MLSRKKQAKTEEKEPVTCDAVDLHDFEQADALDKGPFNMDTLRQSVHFIVSKKDHLDNKLMNILAAIIPHDEKMGLNDMVDSQLVAALCLRNTYFSVNGKLKEGVSGRDAKDALASCQNVINVLMKQQESLDRNARLMKMENILIACVGVLPEEVKKRFLDEVAKQLEE